MTPEEQQIKQALSLENVKVRERIAKDQNDKEYNDYLQLIGIDLL